MANFEKQQKNFFEYIFRVLYRQIPQPRCLRNSRGSRAAPGHFDEVSSPMSHIP